MFHADNSIKLAKVEEYFKLTSKKTRWDKPQKFGAVSFCELSGGGIDYQFLLNTLEKYWRNEATR